MPARTRSLSSQAADNGNIYFTGYTLSDDLFTVGAFQPYYGFGIDLFVAAIKPGTPGRAGLVYCTYGGATGTYVPTSLVLGAEGSVYVGGYGNVGLPITVNGYAGGITDGFILVTK